MNEYTPTTEDVRLVYMANCNRDCSVDHQAEFDRWLQSIQAGAWDEGFDAGELDVWQHWPEDGSKGTFDCIPNPYKEETE